MYISVIPTSKSQSKTTYTYFVNQIWEDQIVVGGVVEVPYGKDLLIGIISEIQDENNIKGLIDTVKPIHRVLSSIALLDTTILQTILKLSDRYFLPIHKSLALFFPISLYRRLEKKNFILKRNILSNTSHRVDGIALHHFVDTIFSPQHLEKYLQSNTVIIFPEDIMLNMFIKSREIQENLLIVQSESTTTKRLQAWIDIYEKKYEIIVGTRRLLYYNLSAYKNIIYIEDAFGSEQFQYPINIRSLDVLSSLEKTNTYNITVVSSSPTLELFSKFPEIQIISQYNQRAPTP